MTTGIRYRGQLHQLGGHHDKADVLRGGLVKQARNQRAGAHGGVGDVAHYAVAAYGLTLSEGSTAGVIGGGASLDNIPDTHRHDMAVGHLNAHEGDLTGGRAMRTLLAPRVRAILSCRLATSESFNPWSKVNS